MLWPHFFVYCKHPRFMLLPQDIFLEYFVPQFFPWLTYSLGLSWNTTTQSKSALLCPVTFVHVTSEYVTPSLLCCLLFFTVFLSTLGCKCHESRDRGLFTVLSQALSIVHITVLGKRLVDECSPPVVVSGNFWEQWAVALMKISCFEKIRTPFKQFSKCFPQGWSVY